MFSGDCAGGNKKTKLSLAILDLCLRKTRLGKSHDHRDAIVFEKLRFQNVSHAHENVKPAFSNSSGLKSVLEKLRFRDGLVWTVGLTVEIKLRFQIPPGADYCLSYMERLYELSCVQLRNVLFLLFRDMNTQLVTQHCCIELKPCQDLVGRSFFI